MTVPLSEYKCEMNPEVKVQGNPLGGLSPFLFVILKNNYRMGWEYSILRQGETAWNSSGLAPVAFRDCNILS